MRSAIPILLLVLLGGCADTSFVTPDAAVDQRVAGLEAGNPWGDLFIGEQAPLPDGFQLGKARVYAHTESALFEIDPDTLAISLPTPFVWPTATDLPKMTDIALDKNGRMIGVSKTTVYAVDPKTAGCTLLATFSSDHHFVGLSFVVDPTADQAEFLMGLGKEGAVYEIDPATGAVKQRGSLGGGLQAGGDVVSIKGVGTLATVTPPSASTDHLARIDPLNGKATLVGDTGFSKVWGLGFWKGKVYGFAEPGQFVLIDVATGKGTLQAATAEAWWGAGVTTEAPAID